MSARRLYPIASALALVALGPVANILPQAALAGLLIVIAYSMIDKHRLMLTWRSGKNPRLVLIGTLASTLLLPLQYAIFIGIFLSIVVHVPSEMAVSTESGVRSS